MNWIQKFFVAIFPKSWGESMEAESRTWMAKCPCGHERSIWEIGGIRWKAAGKEIVRLKCPHCGESRWHTIYKKRPSEQMQTPQTQSV